MRVMGVDPGGTTGVVVWDTDLSECVLCEELRSGGEHSAELRVALLVSRYVVDYDVDLVIIEDFILRGVAGSTKRESLSPARLGFGIACLLSLLAADERAGLEVVLRLAGDAISIMTNDRLKRLGMYVKYPGGGTHVRDAMRHVALELRKRGEL
jgi:hypothetical protein